MLSIFFYVIVSDTVEKSLLMSLGLSTKTTPIQVLRGEILEGVPEAEQPLDLTKVAVAGIERKSLRLACRTENKPRITANYRPIWELGLELSSSKI